MFESADAHAARTWQGAAWGLRAQADENAENAALWADNARQWKAHAKNLEAQLAAAQLALAVEKAHAEGAVAMYQAMKAAHLQSPLVADSGKRFKDGKTKNQARLIYEAAFDRILREAGIADPTKHRVD